MTSISLGSEIEVLARHVADLTGETFHNAIRTALRERLKRVEHCRMRRLPGLADQIQALGRKCAALPDIDV